MTQPREYETSHPWITFQLEAQKIPAAVWILLGEARSKCDHLAGIPLSPATAQRLNQVFLVKGAHATTAIEGNTLSEDQIRAQVEGKLHLPASKQYLAQEVQNVIDAYNGLWNEIRAGKPVTMTVDRILQFNGLVLRDLETLPEVQPGQLRAHSVGVMGYRGAPAADCPYLLARLVDWLNHESFQADAEHGVVKPILAAILAHLYLAWIHPFGDGNGRTARLVEFTILVLAGVPMPAAHVLSNHYNATRSEYYRQLDMASRSRDEIPFIRYAVQGFVDGLREQIGQVRDQQLLVTWINYVHDVMRSAAGSAAVIKRRRELVLELSMAERAGEPRTLDEILRLTPDIALLYSGRSQKMLRRDVNELCRLELLVADGSGRYRPNAEKIAAFLPAQKPPEQPHGSAS